ncbi:hypothetical protein HRbin21_01599 [bacterium HR21]|jgi:hypothetical protein|nr:hypothetical protein HRbin21_01599 [bacterium HR21]
MEFLLIGAAVGLFSGLFGIGGALLATPLLRLAGVEPLLALATPLPAIIPTALSGIAAYWRHRLVDWGTSAGILLGGVPGTLLGALLTRWIGGSILMLLTGALLLAVGLRFLWESWRGGDASPAASAPPPLAPSPLSLLGLGFGTGMVSGLLAIGGGIILVPVLTHGFGFPLKRALATSLVCVAGMALPGTVAHAWLGHVAPQVLLPFLLGSIPLAYLGGSLALVLSSRTLRLLYGSVVVAFALFFLWTQWRN